MSAHAADLASHGYVVVGIDVPGETHAVDLGDGALVPMARASTNASDETIALRSRDMRFVLSRLGSLHGAGRLDLERVGAFGHSNGGATAAAAMLTDRRIARRREPRREPSAARSPSAAWTARSARCRAARPERLLRDVASSARTARPASVRAASPTAAAPQLHRLRVARPAARPDPRG